MSITAITDLVEQAIDELLPERPFGDRPRVRALITAFVEQLQDIEDDRIAMAVQRSIANSVGVQMDQVGKIIGQARAGRNDTDYRVALNARVLANSSEGTPDEVMAMVALLVAVVVTYTRQGTAEFLLEWTTTTELGQPIIDLIGELLAITAPAGVKYQAIASFTSPGPIFQLDTPGSGLDQGLLQKAEVAP